MQVLITPPKNSPSPSPVVEKDNLKITVTDGTNAIEGATVTIGTDEETTTSDGEATFELEYGDYEATIDASGYNTVTETLAFRSNHKNFSITLESQNEG